MLHVSSQLQNASGSGTLVVRLSGSIEELLELEKLVGEIPAGVETIEVCCKEVPRINSNGIRSWVIYFQGLADRGIHLRFTECSPAIVQQLNLIKNFNCGGEVTSIYLPYVCTGCKAEFVVLVTTTKLRTLLSNLPTPACPKCKGKTAFDDIPNEYFSFLSRVRP